MKKQAYTFLVAIVLMALFSVTPTHAQSEAVIVAKVPFNFSIRGRALPPGDYIFRVVQVGSSDALRITSADHHTEVVLPARPSQARGADTEPKLVFNRYSDRYFLSAVYGLEVANTLQLAKNHDEDQLAKSEADRSSVSIAARRP